MSFDLDAGLHGHGMDELAATHLSHTCIAYKDVAGTGKKQIGFHEVDLKAATRYDDADADVTLRLWRRVKARLPAEGGTRRSAERRVGYGCVRPCRSGGSPCHYNKRNG